MNIIRRPLERSSVWEQIGYQNRTSKSEFEIPNSESDSDVEIEIQTLNLKIEIQTLNLTLRLIWDWFLLRFFFGGGFGGGEPLFALRPPKAAQGRPRPPKAAQGRRRLPKAAEGPLPPESDDFGLQNRPLPPATSTCICRAPRPPKFKILKIKI